ncbi:MAG: hypothetical protein Q4F12_02335 [Erysipelotrichaceae bacterium]|nr:hypothetical protein [Erysipelotrichaceae bacterium]
MQELKDEELEQVTGGVKYPDSHGYTYDGYNVVNVNWGCACKKLRNVTLPSEVNDVRLCGYCPYYVHFGSPKKYINGWSGYCTWTKAND